MKISKLSLASMLFLARSSVAFQTPNSNVRGRTFIPNTNTLKTTTTTGVSSSAPQLQSQSLSHSSTTSLSAVPVTAAAAASTLSGITAPIGSVSVLAFVILIHEAGHFLAARSLDIKVKEFSVGVGPKITGFTRKVEDNEDEEGIEFNLRAIPLGGYVRFPENYNATEEYQLEVQAEQKRKEIQEVIKKNREESNLGLLSTVTMALDSSARKSERVAALESMAIDLTSKEQDKSKSWWNNIFGGNKKASDSSQQKSIIISEDGTVSTPPVDYFDDPDLLQNRPWAQRALVLVGGVVFNIILAFSLYFGELTVGGGLQKPTFAEGALVSTAPRVNSAGVGLLEKGDVILSVNGSPINSNAPTVYSSQEGISDFISTIRAAKAGESLNLSILKSQSSTPSEIKVTPQPMNDKEQNSPLSIGVMIAPNYQGNKLVHASNPINAATMAATEVTELTSQTARSILTFLGGLIISGGSAPAGQSLSGPIGVLKTGSDVVKTNDIAAVVGFAAAISVNLAVVNSLPLPALDGGQLIFVLSEAVTGKKVDQRKQEEITAAALFFLLLVSAGTAVGDITSLVR